MEAMTAPLAELQTGRYFDAVLRGIASLVATTMAGRPMDQLPEQFAKLGTQSTCP
jgi:hypothetical protein